MKKGDFVRLDAAEPSYPYKGIILEVVTRYRTEDMQSVPGGYHETLPEFLKVKVYVVRSENAIGIACTDNYEADELEVVSEEYLPPNA